MQWFIETGKHNWSYVQFMRQNQSLFWQAWKSFCTTTFIFQHPKYHWLKYRMKRLHCVLQTVVETHCCTSVLTSSVHADDRISHLDLSLWKICCRWFSGQFWGMWHTSVFSPCFLSLRMVSLLPWDHFWWGFSEDKMDQLKVQMHLSGPVFGLLLVFTVS